MSNISMYMDFISGELDSDSEQKFAEEFAYNESFRKGFRNYLAVTGAINTNIGKFGPPSNVTNAVFAGIGLTSAIPTQTVPQIIANTSIIKSPLISGIVTSVVSILISVSVMYFIFNPANDITSANNEVVSNAVANPLVDYPKVKSDELLSEQKQISKIQYQNLNQATHIYPIDVKKHNSEPDQYQDITEISNVDNSVINTNKQSGYANQNMINTASVNVNENLNSIYSNDRKQIIPNLNSQFTSNITPDISLFSDFQLEVRNAATWNIPKPTVNPSGNQLFYNTGLSLIYEVSNNLSLGFDVRQENYFVKYTGKDIMAKPIQYEQMPNFTSYGLFARYIPEFEIFGLNPSLQLMFGGNYYGFASRANIGFEYSLYSDLSILIQTEYSRLFFRHENSIYSTGKAGINYGINYKF